MRKTTGFRMNRHSKYLNNHGYTLVEIVIVIVILGIIGAFTFQFVAHGVLAFKKTSARKDLYDQGRLALERMVRELRDGKEITDCSSNSITFKKAHPAQAADNIEEVKFELVGTDLKRVGDPSGAAQTAVLASDVTSFQVGGGGSDSVTVDNASYGTTASATASSMTVSHTTGSGSDRLMLVGISVNVNDDERLATTDPVTYGGTSLTKVGERANGNDAMVYIYSLVAPAPGTADVEITFDGNLDYGAIAGVMTLTGVDQSTPLGTFASATGNDDTEASVTIPSADGELVFGVVADEYDAITTAITGQQVHWNETTGPVGGDGPHTNGAGGTASGASSNVVMTWGLDAEPSPDEYNHWAMGGVSIKPSGSDPTPCGVGGLTTVFSDDFEDGVITGWSNASGGDAMQETGGVFTTTGNNTSHYTVDSGSGWTDYSFEADVVGTDNDVAGITFRVEDSDSFYVFQQTFGDGNWNLRLRLYDNGSSSTLTSIDNYGSNPGQVDDPATSYNFKVELSGTNIKAYIDDVLKFDINDATVSGGTVGLWLVSCGGADFDNVLVQSTGGYNLELVPLELTLSSSEGGSVSMRTKVYMRNVPEIGG
jgi:prepilin-type N-terminal cleavage/methylation domain-containing protein